MSEEKIYEAFGLSEEEAGRRADELSYEVICLMAECETNSEFAEKMANYYDGLDNMNKLLIWISYRMNLDKVLEDLIGGE